MAPKKKVEEEAPPPQEEVEEGPPEVFQKCFRTEGGQLYAGECIANNANGTFVRQGQGKQVYTAKNVAGEDCIVGTYEGDWENDVIEGAGMYRWPDGSSYEGCFKAGQLCGQIGKFTWPDGSAYEGRWLNGLMCGKGRFDSKRDGNFMEGTFHRNWFLDNSLDSQSERTRKWISVCGQQAQAEKDDILVGDTAATPVHACTSVEALPDVLGAVEAEGLVPFILTDDSISDDLRSNLFSGNNYSQVMLSEAAFKRRRAQDVSGYFYGALQDALLNDIPLQVMFDDMRDAEPYPPPADCTMRFPATVTLGSAEHRHQPPDEWRLGTFWSDSAFPLEVFNPTLFNGRMGFVPFLPEEQYQDFRSSLSAPAKEQQQQQRQGSKEAPGGDEPPVLDNAEAGLPTPGQVPPRVYHLRFQMAALAKLPAGLSTEDIRALVVGRYGQHAPLHRTALVVLTSPTTDNALEA